MNSVAEPVWAQPLESGWIRFRAADRSRPQILDSLLAAGVLAAAIADLFEEEERGLFGVQGASAWVVVMNALALALPLVWRRRAPLAVFGVVLGVCAVQWAAGLALRSDLSLMIALYGAGSYASPRSLRNVAIATVPVCALLAFRVRPLDSQPWVSLFFVLCAATAAAALGVAGRMRRAQLAALAERAATLEVEREQRELLAAANERARVSRELHDIVGHSLAVIVGLADGGAAEARLQPERGPEVLQTIAEAGRTSLGELRRALGALRAELPEDGGGPELHPQPGTAQLPALCERIRAAGPTVTYTAKGDLSALGAGLQLAVYRIVQEALTNSLKHAGPRTRVRVAVTADTRAGDVLVQVDDTGPPAGEVAADRPGGSHASGQGLIGMRERAALAGGSAVSGRRAGGWTVRAVLPMNHDTRARTEPRAGSLRPAPVDRPRVQERS
ncbi:sensor histidine kinase [Streptomyces sp. NPDC002643]